MRTPYEASEEVYLEHEVIILPEDTKGLRDEFVRWIDVNQKNLTLQEPWDKNGLGGLFGTFIDSVDVWSIGRSRTRSGSPLALQTRVLLDLELFGGNDPEHPVPPIELVKITRHYADFNPTVAYFEVSDWKEALYISNLLNQEQERLNQEQTTALTENYHYDVRFCGLWFSNPFNLPDFVDQPLGK